MKSTPDIAYTTPIVARTLGVTTRQVITFEERGYIEPSVKKAAGHGSKRLWSFDDVVKCAILQSVRGILTVNAIRDLGQFMHEHGIDNVYEASKGKCWCFEIDFFHYQEAVRDAIEGEVCLIW